MDLITQKSSAPWLDLNCLAIFCFTLLFIIALSEALLSRGSFMTIQKSQNCISVFLESFL